MDGAGHRAGMRGGAGRVKRRNGRDGVRRGALALRPPRP